MRTTKPEDKRSQDREAWLGWVHKYADRLAQQGESRSHEDRARAMNAVNPAFVLRSWIAQDAIEVSELQQRQQQQQLASEVFECRRAEVLCCARRRRRRTSARCGPCRRCSSRPSTSRTAVSEGGRGVEVRSRPRDHPWASRSIVADASTGLCGVCPPYDGACLCVSPCLWMQRREWSRRLTAARPPNGLILSIVPAPLKQ